MSTLGAMVASGISPEVLDRMDLCDITSWYLIMAAFEKERGTISAGGNRP